MKLAAIQFAPALKETARNIQTARYLAVRAAEAGAKVIVLPELCTSGYSLMSEADAMPYAEEAENAVAGPLGRIAKEYEVAIAWGFIEKRAGKLYNSQLLVTPNKHVVSRKLNQWGNDFLWATEGKDSPPILEFGGKKLGTLICRDIRDKGPKWSALQDFYEPGDADIVCFSSNFGDGAFPSVSWVEFARTNKVWFIVSNRYGREQNNNFGEGGICVIEPGGKVHCEGLKWNEPCIVYANVP